ncbi:MAG TPA: class I tRNA ligase family protein [Candidatus Paceibacterota bacterium]|nr:class I tRNA ligase family protein [Candidatus Paceibacterota bacterium]
MADFRGTTERIRKFWQERDIFAKSMDPKKGGKARKDFVFFEGPPTANGSPGIHHFIGRSFKDLFARFWTMRGYRVLRKGGWDTHGLPVELQVEKELGFKSKKDIEKYGIAKFNAKCRESVWKFKNQWEEFTRRMAYWVDLDDPYVTYEAPYVESLWHVIRRFADKKLLYRAHRVIPFCTRCGTGLSSHEVALGYQTVSDRSVYVSFRLKSGVKVKGADGGTVPLPRGTAVVAWTTTAWTLPGNVALAVGPRIEYVLAKRGEDYFIVAKELAVQVLGAPLAIEAEFKGSALAGLAYEPLFSVPKLRGPRSYRILEADFVSTTDGTGIVHTAVMYGDDDYKLGTKAGLPKHHTVSEQGTFTGVHKDLNGRYVKDAKTEQRIVDLLAAKGRLVREQPYEHEYPFCWRCGTPLLYYAKDSWFVSMSSLRAKLLSANAGVNWIPGHLRDGRFGQWLNEGKDWAFSRERYWGTPLPAWSVTDRRGKPSGEPLIIGSYEELEKYRADKPATLWVMRHGEAENNVKNIVDSGQGNFGLTATGRAQARRAARNLARKLRSRRQKFAAVISSPIQRTRETAEIAAEELGIRRVVTDKRLAEIELGPTLAGCHDSRYHDAYPTYRLRFEQRPPNGESLEDLRARVWTVLRDLQVKYAGKHILVVSHEYPIWMMAMASAGWDRRTAIAAKEARDPKPYVTYAQVEPMTVKNLPRDATGTVDPHRPFVDEVVLRHPATKKILRRVPDLVDVWFDSGAMPLAQWHWPFENRTVAQGQFPADFIAEGIDQTRGWFYTLLAVSVALGKGAPYRNVLSFGHVLDDKGRKMSKSKGNVVDPAKVMDDVGVDAARWYFYTVNAPGDPKLFDMKDVRERLTGFIMILENCLRFWELYAAHGAGGDWRHGERPTHMLDRWLMSRLHRVIADTTAKMEAYDPTAAARELEHFVVSDLSQWWLRRSRKRPEALGFLRHVLLELDKLLAPFVPYLAEDMHQRLHRGAAPGTESVHLHDWPAADPVHFDTAVEEQMARLREFVTAGLAQRKDAGIRVRQPLASVTVPLPAPLPGDLEQLLKDELNVKSVAYEPAGSVSLDRNISPVLMREGWAREVMRQLQDMRKEAGLKMGEHAYGQWHAADADLADAIGEWADAIATDTSLKPFVRRPDDERTSLTVEKEFELAPGKSVWLGVRK